MKTKQVIEVSEWDALVEPYPKGESKRYDASGTIETQMVLLVG